MSGTLPIELFNNVPYLTSLGLESNQLVGTVPTEIGKLSYLQKLNLCKLLASFSFVFVFRVYNLVAYTTR